MGIKKNNNGTFDVSYSERHPVTRVPCNRRRKSIKSMAEAKRVYAELVVKVNELLKREIIPNWSQFLGSYLLRIDQEGELTKGTVYKRDKVLKRHTLPLWSDKLIDEITPQDIRDLINNDLGDKSESHKKFVLKGVRNVFQDAVDQRFIASNPTPAIKFKINDKIKTCLNEKQIMMLLQKADELGWFWYPHYAVALFTGMRSGEMFALTWDKVNFESRQILVDCAWSSKDGFKSTKSGNDRIVEIPKPLLPILRELKIKAENEFVLPRSTKWEQGEQARDLRLFLKSIGLPEVRFHDLRASWATWLLSKGVAPSRVMAMGGWVDMKTMMIYMRKAGIDIKGATSCLDDFQISGQTQGKVLDFVTV